MNDMKTSSMNPTDRLAWASGNAAYEPGDRPVDAALKAYYRGYQPNCRAYDGFIAGFNEALGTVRQKDRRTDLTYREQAAAVASQIRACLLSGN